MRKTLTVFFPKQMADALNQDDYTDRRGLAWGHHEMTKTCLRRCTTSETWVGSRLTLPLYAIFLCVF